MDAGMPPAAEYSMLCCIKQPEGKHDSNDCLKSVTAALACLPTMRQTQQLATQVRALRGIGNQACHMPAAVGCCCDAHQLNKVQRLTCLLMRQSPCLGCMQVGGFLALSAAQVETFQRLAAMTFPAVSHTADMKCFAAFAH